MNRRTAHQSATVVQLPVADPLRLLNPSIDLKVNLQRSGRRKKAVQLRIVGCGNDASLSVTIGNRCLGTLDRDALATFLEWARRRVWTRGHAWKNTAASLADSVSAARPETVKALFSLD